MNKADRERVENIRENVLFLPELEGEDTEFLLSIIDKQDKVVEAARKNHAFCPITDCDICRALKDLDGDK